MPIMIFDRGKNAVQFLSNAQLAKITDLNLTTANSFRAHNYASVNGNRDAVLDSNGPWAFGAYALTTRQLKSEYFTDANSNGRLDSDAYTDTNRNGIYDTSEPFVDMNGNGRFDSQEENDITESYSGRGYYRFGLSALTAGSSEYDNVVPYFAPQNGVSGQQAWSYNWSLSFASIGYRTGMDIHVGRYSTTDFFKRGATLGCIRVDDESLANLDRLHGIEATTSGVEFISGLAVVSGVRFVATKSLPGYVDSVLLIDARDFGGGGTSVLTAGSGRDFLVGSSSTNVLSGGVGADYIFGRGGNDKLYGGMNADNILAGTGNDIVFANVSAADVADNDQNTIDGGWGNDTLYGASGDDRLFGQQDSDKIFGGRGHDYLIGDYDFSGYGPASYLISDHLSGKIKPVSQVPPEYSYFSVGDGLWAPAKVSAEAPSFFQEADGAGFDATLLYGGHRWLYYQQTCSLSFVRLKN